MLEKLLAQAEELWGSEETQCYQFHLGLIYGKWCFKVVNSWQKWKYNNGLDTEFYGETPVEAVESFLVYVKLNKIDVRSLMDD